MGNCSVAMDTSKFILYYFSLGDIEVIDAMKHFAEITDQAR